MMTAEGSRSGMRRALLGVVPEEVAFEWVFSRENVGWYGQPSSWPYDGKRTMAALKPKKRTANEMTTVFLPLFSDRPDILTDIARVDKRVTVIKSMFSVFTAKNCTLDQFLTFRDVVGNALHRIPDELDSHIEGYIYRYGEEAYRKLVHTSSSDQFGYFVYPTHGMVASLAANLVANGRSPVEAIEISELKESQTVLAVIELLSSKQLDFSVEEIVQFMKDNELIFFQNDIISVVKSVPARYFATMRSAVGLSYTLLDVLSDNSYLRTCQRYIADRYTGLIDEDANALVTPEGVQAHTLSSVEEYGKVPEIFYGFRVQGRDEPIGVLDYSGIGDLGKTTGQIAWQHILDNFAVTWQAARKLAAEHYVQYYDTEFPHLAFDPVEVFDDFLSNILSGDTSSVISLNRGLTSMEILVRFITPEIASQIPKETLRRAREATRVQPKLLNWLSQDIIRRMFDNMPKEDVLDIISSSFVEAITEKGLTYYMQGTSHYPRSFTFMNGEETVEVLKEDMQSYVISQIYKIAKSYMHETSVPKAGSRRSNVAHAIDEMTSTGSLRIHKFLNDFQNSLTRDNYTEKVRELSMLGTSYGHPNYVLVVRLAETFPSINRDAKFSPYELPDFVDFILEGVNSGQIRLPSHLKSRSAEFMFEGKLDATGSLLLDFGSSELIARLQEEFKEHPSVVWDNYISMAPDWGGTFTELVETVKIVSA